MITRIHSHPKVAFWWAQLIQVDQLKAAAALTLVQVNPLYFVLILSVLFGVRNLYEIALARPGHLAGKDRTYDGTGSKSQYMNIYNLIGIFEWCFVAYLILQPECIWLISFRAFRNFTLNFYKSMYDILLLTVFEVYIYPLTGQYINWVLNSS